MQTRLRDRELLARSLRDLGANIVADDDGLHAETEDVRLRFTVNEEGTAVAHVEAGDLADATRLIHAVDEQYAAHVQVALYERVKARASRMGLTIESEQVGEDNAMTIILAVDETGV